MCVCVCMCIYIYVERDTFLFSCILLYTTLQAKKKILIPSVLELRASSRGTEFNSAAVEAPRR